MHQARLGILADDDGDDTDDGDDAFSVMERLDKHLMRSLENMHSPAPWVRQSVVLGLSAVHGTSLLAVINSVLRMTRTTVAPDYGRGGTAPDDDAEAAAAAAAAAAAGGGRDGGASKATPGIPGMASHLADLTRLMSQLSHHVAMPDVLLSCPEMLPHLLDFMQQESAATAAIETVSTAIVSIVTIVAIVAIVSTAMVKDAVAVSGAAAWLACTTHTHICIYRTPRRSGQVIPTLPLTRAPPPPLTR